MNPKIERGTALHTLLFVLGPFQGGKPVWKCLVKLMVLIAAIWVVATWWLFSFLRLLRVLGACATGPFCTGHWYTWSWRYIVGLETKFDWWKSCEPIAAYQKSWWPKEKGKAWPPAFALFMCFLAIFWAFFTSLGVCEIYLTGSIDIVSGTIWCMNVSLILTCGIFVLPWTSWVLTIVGPIVSRKEIICPKVSVDA